jgi:hypothetical protein
MLSARCPAYVRRPRFEAEKPAISVITAISGSTTYQRSNSNTQPST